MKKVSVVIAILYTLLVVFACENAKANQGVFAVPSTGTATSTSTKVLNTDALREYLIIQNTGSNSIAVKFGSAQTAGEGVVIAAGGNYEPFDCPTNSVYLEALSGTSTYIIQYGH